MTDFFINPWMLSGLALLSAPIIIHLLNKKRFVIVDWAAMDFLFQAESRNRRRIRIEDLLLLLLRILLIALIVLALARPVFQSYIGDREDERTVVIDDSFSMEASGGTGIPFIAARGAAERQVEEAVGRGIAFNVWLGSQAQQIGASSPDAPDGAAAGGGGIESGGAGGTAQSQGAMDGSTFAARSGEVLRSVRDLEMNDAPLSIGLLLERLRERFVSIDKPLMRSVVLLSDYRSSDWMIEDSSELRPEIAAGVAALETEGVLDRLQWRFVNLGNEGRENLSVVGLHVDTDVPTVRAPVKLTVEIENFGEQERRGIRGWVEIGRPVAEASVDGATWKTSSRASSLPIRTVKFSEIATIAAGEKATVTVECTIDAPGEYPVTAIIEGTGDRLERDDRTHAVLQVRRGLKVLLVDGDPGRERFAGEAGFLAAALAPRGRLSSDIVIDEVRGTIPDDGVRSADVILVLNRSDFTATELALLRRFVRRGGGLGFFLGSRVRPERYAELFPAPKDEADEGATGGVELPLFPATLESSDSRAAGPGRVHLKIADAQHRAFEVFRGVEGSSLEQVGFDRFFKVTLHPGARVVATYDDVAKTPAIIDAEITVAAAAASSAEASSSGDSTSSSANVSRKSATGKVVVFNMTADRDWSDWPTDPSYPIVFQEWARYLAPRLGDERRVTAGGVMSWDRVPGVRYDVVLPSGEVRPLESQEESASAKVGTIAYFRDTYQAGFYRVIPSKGVAGAQIAAGALEPFVFACVRDSRESRLTPVDETRLTMALEALGVNLVVGRSERGRLVTKEEGGEIWRWLAMGAGIFLVVELFTAWWMGRR